MAATPGLSVSPDPALTVHCGMSNHWSLVTELQLELLWHSRGHQTNSNLWLCSDKCDQTPHERWRRLDCAWHAAGIEYVRCKFKECKGQNGAKGGSFRGVRSESGVQETCGVNIKSARKKEGGKMRAENDTKLEKHLQKWCVF